MSKPPTEPRPPTDPGRDAGTAERGDVATEATVFDGVTVPRGGASLVGQTLDGRYEVLARLGRGGMGTVYKARHVLMDQVVALKVINESLADRPDVRERFLREAKATMKFVHSNVVPVRELGVTREGILYMTLDYSPGRSLRTLLAETGPFPERRVTSIARQILRALEAAHAHGIVHRDLKPENILLERGEKPGAELVRVLDFGMAKLLETSIADSDGESLTGGTVMGTPHYMAPEQACGSGADARTDLYALGCILYELLTGVRVFTADSASKVLLKHLTQAPVPPSRLAPLLSPKLESLILKSLEKEPENRPRSAGEMLRALGEIDVRLRTARKLRVLFADDSPINQKLTTRMLELWGHEVVVATNGREVLELTGRSDFDLIIVDGQMPELDGFEATAALRAREAGTGRHTPVIAMTADSSETVRTVCLEAGMDAHVSKRSPPEDLFEAIEQIVRAANRSDEAVSRAGDGVFDSATALARAGGDVALLREIVELFLVESRRLLVVVRTAAATGRLDQLARAAYELKGVSGNCAATALEEAAARAQRLAQAGRAAEVGPAVEAIGVAYSRLIPALARVLEKRTERGADAPGTAA